MKASPITEITSKLIFFNTESNTEDVDTERNVKTKHDSRWGEKR